MSAELFQKITACSHADPGRKNPKRAGKWLAVMMRPELWEEIQQAASRPPASSERVALTTERLHEIHALHATANANHGLAWHDFARAIEAAHGIPAPARGDVLASGQIKEPASESLKESDQ